MKSKLRGMFVLSPQEILFAKASLQKTNRKDQKNYYHKTVGDKMKTKTISILILALIYSLQINFAQKKLKSPTEDLQAVSISYENNSPCPVGAPSNPNPMDGAVGVSIYYTVIAWINGAETTNVEVWFGQAGDVVKVYDGPAITSWSTGLLIYQMNYLWRIVCKNDTCATQGLTWSFTTEPEPFPGYWCDVFANMNNWTIVGPSGITNWTASNSSLAGGTAPELNLSWTPSFNGQSKIRSIPISLLNHQCCLFSFNFYFDWFANPSGIVTIGITYDGGLTSTIIFSLTNPTGNIGPINFSETFGTPLNGSEYCQLEITYSGYSFNIDNIFWDNVCISYLLSNMCPPGAPGNLTAQVIFNPNPQVQLGWQDNSWNESGFNVMRKNGQPNDPGEYVLVGTAGQNQIQYIDATVLPESTYTYRVFAYNQYGQNGSNTMTIAVPVPVELISFTAEVDENVVTLFWQTATETNNSGFEILRSAQNDSEGWEKIGFVEGKGTTTEIQTYSFTDKPEPGNPALPADRYKYRLKQIDFNGSFAFSPEVEAEVKAPNVFSLEQNYPNPFNPSTVISYQLPISSKVELKVYDVLGNEVATLVDEEQTVGVYEVEFNPESSIKNLPASRQGPASGIYFYQLKAGSFIETKKMSLIK